jgi:peptidoglycan/LPS O-acetylase OafA/YrhL
LSGYLITTIIIKDIKNNNFSFIVFYLKRIRRLIPALYIVLIFSTVLAYLTLSPNDGKDYYQSLVATILFNSNTLFYIESSNYFGLSAEYKPLLHTWSLGVEEQFYLFYPILLIVVCKLKDINSITFVLVVCGLLSYGFMLFGYSMNSSAAFYLLPMRSWELFLGACVAIYLNKINNKINRFFAEFGGLLGLILIINSIFFFDINNYPLVFFITSVCFGTAFIIICTTQQTLIKNLLTQKYLVWIGLISYSAYLWHQPLIVYFKYYVLNSLNIINSIIIFFIILLFSLLTYQYVEQPFRNKNIISNKIFLLITVIFSFGFLTIGLIGHKTWGFKESKIANIPDDRRWILVDHDFEANRKKLISEEFKKNTVETKNSTSKRKVLILGDSVSHDLDLAFKIKENSFSNYTFQNISLDDLQMKDFLQYLKLSSNFSYDNVETNFAEIKTALNSVEEVILAAAWSEETSLEAFELAKYLAKNKKIYIVDAFRVFNMAESSFYFASSHIPLYLNATYMFDRLLVKYLLIRDYFLKNISQYKNIEYIDKYSFFCDAEEKSCVFYNTEKKPLLHDEIHLTVEGEYYYADALVRNGYFQ